MLVNQIRRHSNRVAVVEGARDVTYGELDRQSVCVASSLLAGVLDLHEARVAFHVTPGADYASTLLGIWRAGGIAVPLAMSHPPAELEYVVRDAAVSLIVAEPSSVDTLKPVAVAAGVSLTTVSALQAGKPVPLPIVAADRRALMMYTSGTTGRPKGVVTTHANVSAQIASLVGAWEWTAGDRTVLALPLHHVHGLINVLGSALWSGAVCDILARFDAEAVWARLAAGNVTVFTAVPTIYHRLIAAWDAAPPEVQQARSDGCRQVRLMMSGSAALPRRTLERWRAISGHTLLERYGMTEIGMALSNPLHGERRPGSVGVPLPGVEVRLVDERLTDVPPGTAGELLVRGPGVFVEYWRQPAATAEAFADHWFRTGDIGVLERGAYRLLGRRSIDIIKTGGHKVSALEIEEVMRRHPSVAECAVVGVDDPEWGQRVCAAVELREREDLSLPELTSWLQPQIAPYKIPRELRCVASLPRNAMGKVLKPDVTTLFLASGDQAIG
jgi:malonyl-CoA/methylmalonyl-CoA synthetase